MINLRETYENGRGVLR